MELSIVSVIVSGLTAVSAIVAPIAQAVIARRGAIRRDAMSMLYQSRLDAYTQFLSASYAYQASLSKETLLALYRSIDSAMLVASPASQEPIAALANLISGRAFDASDASARMEYSAARYRAVLAMQSDLRQHQPKPHQTRHAAKLANQSDRQLIRYASDNGQDA